MSNGLSLVKNKRGKLPTITRFHSDKMFTKESELQEWLVNDLKKSFNRDKKPRQYCMVKINGFYEIKRVENYSYYALAGEPVSLFDEIDVEVCCDYGRVDIVVLGKYIIECKLKLGINSVARALGQLWLYKGSFPGYHPVVAGVPLNNEYNDGLEKRILECGVSVWTIKPDKRRMVKNVHKN